MMKKVVLVGAMAGGLTSITMMAGSMALKEAKKAIKNFTMKKKPSSKKHEPVDGFDDFFDGEDDVTGNTKENGGK